MPALLYTKLNRHATWLELFFDLVFVAVIGVITHDLAHTHVQHISVQQLLHFPLVFIPVWWIWITHTLFANRFDSDSRQQRLLSLVLMALMVVLSTFAQGGANDNFSYFIVIYSAIRFLQSANYYSIHRSNNINENFAKDISKAIATGASISLSAAILESSLQTIVFYFGIVIESVWQIRLRDKTRNHPVDREHLIERLGLLAIIILGESMIAMVGSLTDVVWTTTTIVGAVSGFILIGAIWWIYFDSFHILERSKRIKSANTIVYSHLLLCMGLLILANMIRHAILDDLDQTTFGLLALTGLVLFYLGKQIPYWYAFPPWRPAIVSNTLVCFAVTLFATRLPSIQMAMFGMMTAVSIYVYLTHKRILTVSVADYLVKD